MITEVLSFWFEETQPRLWFTATAKFDRQVRERFQPLLQAAAAAELSDWRSCYSGRLAEIIVLDQFSRNVYRGTPQAYAQDAMALALAQEAVTAGALLSLDPDQCHFLLMPYMHSESAVIHRVAEPLFRQYARVGHKHEVQHKAIIERFGRYPHRNKVLGRESSTEELEFLQQPNSSF
jgi:uncharacterized protein (DUF924 family)